MGRYGTLARGMMSSKLSQVGKNVYREMERVDEPRGKLSNWLISSVLTSYDIFIWTMKEVLSVIAYELCSRAVFSIIIDFVWSAYPHGHKGWVLTASLEPGISGLWKNYWLYHHINFVFEFSGSGRKIGRPDQQDCCKSPRGANRSERRAGR